MRAQQPQQQSMLPMYDQYGYPIYRPMYNQQPQYMQPQPVQQPIQQQVYCRPVTSEDEAKGALIEFDGSLNIFTNLKQGIIYTKQLENDGTAPLKKYVLVTDDSQEQVPTSSMVPAQNPVDMSDYVLKKDFDDLYKMYDSVACELENLAHDFDDYVASQAKPTKSKKPKLILEDN